MIARPAALERLGLGQRGSSGAEEQAGNASATATDLRGRGVEEVLDSAADDCRCTTEHADSVESAVVKLLWQSLMRESGERVLEWVEGIGEGGRESQRRRRERACVAEFSLPGSFGTFSGSRGRKEDERDAERPFTAVRGSYEGRKGGGKATRREDWERGR